MKIQWRVFFGALLSGAALLTLTPALAQSNPIKIGQSLPLSGPLTELGTEYRDGAQAYLKWVNSKGGVHGRQVELITLDDGYVVDKSLANAKQLIDDDKVLALLGMFGSANYGAMMPLINERAIPSLAPYTGSDELRAEKSPSTFWLRASYGDEAEKIIDQLTTLGIVRIAAFYQNDAFGKNGLAGVENALKKRNLKLLGSGEYDKAKNDVSGAVKAIAALDPQAVVMISTYKPTAAFVKQMRAVGQAPQFFALSVVGYKALHAELGREVVGIAISQVVPYPWSGTTQVVRELNALPKTYQPTSGITYTALEGYLAARILVEGLNRTGPQLSREKLLSALESMRPYDLGGFTVNYDNKTHAGSHFVELTIVGNSGRLMR
jgi:ABC-type branched-subunit amino acid transport system substrate-binding protein